MKKRTTKGQPEVAASAFKSDVPEVLDWSAAEIGKFCRPAKKPVTLRRDGGVMEWLKSFGPGYQTRANGLLRHAMEASVPKHRETGGLRARA